MFSGYEDSLIYDYVKQNLFSVQLSAMALSPVWNFVLKKPEEELESELVIVGVAFLCFYFSMLLVTSRL